MPESANPVVDWSVGAWPEVSWMGEFAVACALGEFKHCIPLGWTEFENGIGPVEHAVKVSRTRCGRNGVASPVTREYRVC